MEEDYSAMDDLDRPNMLAYYCEMCVCLMDKLLECKNYAELKGYKDMSIYIKQQIKEIKEYERELNGRSKNY